MLAAPDSNFIGGKHQKAELCDAIIIKHVHWRLLDQPVDALFEVAFVWGSFNLQQIQLDHQLEGLASHTSRLRTCSGDGHGTVTPLSDSSAHFLASHSIS